MLFRSTRKTGHLVPLAVALERSLADDGGLFVPEDFPRFSVPDFQGLETLPAIAARWLSPFFEGDALEEKLPGLCARAFDFPLTLRFLDPQTAILELFHGPTAAFKDFGARFLAECLAQLPSSNARARTVLVATSGDTGGAVAAAFHRRPGFEVLVLFPKGKVSARQEKQLTAWGENVRAFAVRGNFDDCQRMVKSAFADPWWRKNKSLISANSISLGRLLPQAAYYAAASLWFYRRTDHAATFIVPSGNLGNATGAMWARRTGLPLGRIVLALNANRVVFDYFETGTWKPQPTVTTLANAMDVGNPSNMERVFQLYPLLSELKRDVAAISVNDEQIRHTIAEGFSTRGEIWCPHTATAAFAWKHLSSGPAVIVATAHPAKFETIVEPLVKKKVEIPAALGAILTRPAQAKEIEPTLEALREAL